MGCGTKLKAKPENASLLQAAATKLAAATEWSEQSVQEAVEAAAKELNVKPGAMMPLLFHGKPNAAVVYEGMREVDAQGQDAQGTWISTVSHVS